MTFGSDDVAGLFSGDGREHTGYGQGVILDWSPTTFRNRIAYRGGVLTDLPVMDRIGALTYEPGDTVLLMRWTPSGGGVSSYWIAGAPVLPGAGRAEQAIEFMRSALAEQISAGVLASRIHSAKAPGNQSSTSTSYVTLTGGPSIPNINVTGNGKMLVGVGCEMDIVNSATTLRTGSMSFLISGPSVVNPSDNRSYKVGNLHSNSSNIDSIVVGAMNFHEVVDLEPGEYTVSARYRVVAGTQAIIFRERNLVVFAF